MKMHENNAGLAAEKLAATFLAERGLKLVTQNFHCRFGEIDLVMTEATTLVFIEVRLRSNARFGSAALSITPQKQQKLILTAQYYCQQHAIQSPCRFDVILMHKAELSAIEWIKNAFEAG
jgi:putative endonuclease